MKLTRKSADKPSARGYLDGQILIAMPAMSDERFSRSVIYVCAHSTEGAMGIIVNKPAANIKFPDLHREATQRDVWVVQPTGPALTVKLARPDGGAVITTGKDINHEPPNHQASSHETPGA